MRFLGLGLSDRVPDAKTIWLFRERLTKAGAIAALFEHFDRTLREAGYIPMSGQIVNASLVATPRRRNTNAEKADIKAGRIPEHWKNNPAKLRHKGCDTRWTLKFTKASRWRMARCRQSISPFRPFGYIRARFLVHFRISPRTIHPRRAIWTNLFSSTASRRQKTSAIFPARRGHVRHQCAGLRLEPQILRDPPLTRGSLNAPGKPKSLMRGCHFAPILNHDRGKIGSPRFAFA